MEYVSSSFATVKLKKKTEFFWQQTLMCVSHACQFSWWNDICGGLSKKDKIMLEKKTVFGSILEHRFCFFHRDLYESHFVMKFCTHVKKTTMFVVKKNRFFLNVLKIFFLFYCSKGCMCMWAQAHKSTFANYVCFPWQ